VRFSPQRLRGLAVWLFVIPSAVALAAQLVIWCIPGCNPNPYALGECLVGAVNVAQPLLILLLGGAFAAAILGVLVAVPMFLLADGLSAWLKRRGMRDV